MRSAWTVLALCVAACGSDPGGARGVELTPEPMQVLRYAIAPAGEDFVVVWSGNGSDGTERQIWAVRVAADGTIVTPATNLGSFGAVSGLAVLAGPPMVIVQRPYSGMVRARTLDPLTLATGAPVDLDTVSMCDGVRLGLAPTATGFVMMYCTNPEISARPFGFDLQPRGQRAQISDGGDQPELRALADGSLLALWRQDGLIRHARLDPDTAAPVTVPAPVFDTAQTQRASASAALGDGRALVSWLDGYRGHRSFLMFAADGRPAWADVRALVPENRIESVDAAVAARGDRVRVFWQDTSVTALPVIRTGVLDGEALTEVEALNEGSQAAFDPAAAAGPEAFGVVYEQHGDGRYGLRFHALP